MFQTCMKATDLPIGTTFGSYTIVGPSVSSGSDRYWPCRCVCRNERLVKGGNLKSGRSNSCGCQAGARISKAYASRAGRPRKDAVPRPPRPEAPAPTPTPEFVEDPPRTITPAMKLALAMRKSGARWKDVLDVTGLSREEVEP